MKKKIVILGCENSHADVFLRFMQSNEKYADVETVGVYSEEREAARKLHEKYGVPVLSAFDDAAGEVDGVIVTARHGAKHYPFAKPYLKRGLALFVDKPITVSPRESVEFMKAAKAAGVRVTGGSCLRFEPNVCALKAAAEKPGCLGGFLRAPVSLKNAYGNFFFYAQHLVEPMCEIFGRHPLGVRAFTGDDRVTALVRYGEYEVTALFVNENYFYCGAVQTADGADFRSWTPDECFLPEFDEFYDILCGGGQKCAYEDFIASVFVTDAIARSVASSKEERVERYGV